MQGGCQGKSLLGKVYRKNRRDAHSGEGNRKQTRYDENIASKQRISQVPGSKHKLIRVPAGLEQAQLQISPSSAWCVVVGSSAVACGTAVAPQVF